MTILKVRVPANFNKTFKTIHTNIFVLFNFKFDNAIDYLIGRYSDWEDLFHTMYRHHCFKTHKIKAEKQVKKT